MRASDRRTASEPPEVVEFVPRKELDRAEREIERLQKENDRLKQEGERLKQESEHLRRELGSGAASQQMSGGAAFPRKTEIPSPAAGAQARPKLWQASLPARSCAGR